MGNTSPIKVNFLAKKVLKLGQFVYIVYKEDEREKKLLGMVESVERFNRYIHDGISDFENMGIVLDTSETKVTGRIQILGEIKEYDGNITLEMLKTPPPPSAKVVKPEKSLLEKLFGKKGNSFVRIGKLLSEEEEIPVHIDISQVVLRHLAILAITGAGKSNTVSVLLDQIGNLNGTVVVFDFHGEYINSKFERDGKKIVKDIKAGC